MLIGYRYSLDEVAEATGLSKSVLHVWEQRYGWPNPPRNPTNGYREYPKAMVDDLRRMKALVDAGCLPSQLIVDGVPRWPDVRSTQAPKWRRLDALARPQAEPALRFRDRLVRQVKERYAAGVAEQLHCQVYLRAADRLDACWLPAWFGHRLWLKVGRPLEIRAFEALFLRLAGTETRNLVHAQWLAGDD